jgi:hypothetical protein
MQVVLTVSGIQNKTRRGTVYNLIKPVSFKAYSLIIMIDLCAFIFQPAKKVTIKDFDSYTFQYPPPSSVDLLQVFGCKQS